MMEMDQLLTLIQAVSESSLSSVSIKEGNMEISLKKRKKIVSPGVIEVENNSYQQNVENNVDNLPKISINSGFEKVVTSPLVGTFYSAASPEAEAFVKKGDIVKKGQVIGIIEAMKLMNEIESEYDGTIEAILVNNEEMVEYGQPLFRIK